MRYAKMLALAAVAAGALMAFIGAGTASATVLCSTTADPCPTGQDVLAGTVVDLSSTGSTVLTDTSGETTLDTCTVSTLKGKTTNTGGTTETVEIGVETLSWEKCTFPTKTLKTADLEVHKIATTSNGTVTAGGTFEVTINTIFFGSCIYGVTKGTSIGDLTEGKPAIFHATKAVAEKFSGSAAACPETSLWTSTYTVTEPKETTLSVSTFAQGQ